CNQQAHFDVWSMHPYTSGSPEHHSADPNDVSIPELPNVQATLRAANSLGQIVSTNPLQFWVTEFSWDTNPPDPGAVPMKLAQRAKGGGDLRARLGEESSVPFSLKVPADRPGNPFG